MDKVWLVEAGEYSDYHVVGVFTSEQNANRIAQIINSCDHYDDARVRSVELDPAISQLNDGLQQFHVSIEFDGTGDASLNKEFSTYDLGSESLRVWERATIPHGTHRKDDCLTGNVWAKDSSHALKIANKKRAQAIAEGRMITVEMAKKGIKRNG